MPVYSYERKDGSIWWGYRINVGYFRKERRGIKTRDEATSEYLREKQAAMLAHKQGTLFTEKPTIGKLMDDWLEHKGKRVRESTLDDYRVQAARIREKFGKRKIDEIGPVEFQRFLDGIEGARKANKTLTALRNAYRYAMGLQLIYSDPTVALKGRTQAKPSIRYLEDAEIEKLLRALTDKQFRVMVVLALTTGMRAGEIIALTWADIDPHFIQVNKSWRKGRLTLPKTAKGMRQVQIPSSTYEALLWWRTQRAEAGEDELVFSQANGKPWEASILTKRLSRAGTRAGIGHVHFHVLRHTFAAHVLSSGQSPQYLQEMLGHATVSFTIDRYGHLTLRAHKEYRRWADTYFRTLIDETEHPLS